MFIFAVLLHFRTRNEKLEVRLINLMIAVLLNLRNQSEIINKHLLCSFHLQNPTFSENEKYAGKRPVKFKMNLPK